MRIIHCPSCRRRLHLPDEGLVRSLQCPACRAVFEAVSSVLSSLGTTALGGRREDGFRPAEVHDVPANSEWHRPDVDEDTAPSFSLVLQKAREGIVRRTLAVVGFVGGIVVGLFAFADYALDRQRSFGDSLGAFVLALILSPVFGIVLAAIGAGFGIWIEIAIRLVKRRPGESVLLTLVGDEDTTPAEMPSSFFRDETNGVLLNSDEGDSSGEPPPGDPAICKPWQK